MVEMGRESTMVEVDVVRIQREVFEEFMTERWRILSVEIYRIDVFHRE